MISIRHATPTLCLVTAMTSMTSTKKNRQVCLATRAFWLQGFRILGFSGLGGPRTWPAYLAPHLSRSRIQDPVGSSTFLIDINHSFPPQYYSL